MTVTQALYNRYQRYRTLKTSRITALPLLILMPHSACNCRCLMCDIWKDNKNLKQLSEKDIHGLLESLDKLRVEKILVSGGEALLNPNFFNLCRMLKDRGMNISLLSTGLLLEKYAPEIISYTDDVIVSLDGDEETHDEIRNIPGAFSKLRKGVKAIKDIDPLFRITGRSVIQQKNFRKWPAIIESAKELGLDQVSFLPADVSSHAFNREILWSDQRQQEVLPRIDQLPLLSTILEHIIDQYAPDFISGYIAESPAKLRNIYTYYAACYGLNQYPYKKCNAPWVSAVIEPDGNVKPCFFHPSFGNIRDNDLSTVLNKPEALAFRKNLDTGLDPVCIKCVCYLNLSPGVKPV
jgi:MoaA/NifB/PqqE/SkfB family radical SAM enzyme